MGDADRVAAIVPQNSRDARMQVQRERTMHQTEEDEERERERTTVRQHLPIRCRRSQNLPHIPNCPMSDTEKRAPSGSKPWAATSHCCHRGSEAKGASGCRVPHLRHSRNASAAGRRGRMPGSGDRKPGARSQVNVGDDFLLRPSASKTSGATVRRLGDLSDISRAPSACSANHRASTAFFRTDSKTLHQELLGGVRVIDHHIPSLS